MRIAGKPAASTIFRSPAELLVELAPRMGLPAMLGGLELAVANADGKSDTRQDLLSHGYYSSVSLSPTAAVATNQPVSYVGDLSGDGRGRIW